MPQPRGNARATRSRMAYQPWLLPPMPARRHHGASRRRGRPLLCIDCILWLALSGTLGLLLHHVLSQAFGTIIYRMPFF